MKSLHRAGGVAYLQPQPAAAMAITSQNLENRMCACAQRRVAIASAAVALIRGDGAQVKAQAGFIASSSIADLKALTQNAARMAARSRLAR